ncbi:MAG: HEAT repeat domain-containing protein [Proteobacteria bacterium]|nr:HEAT repeat domain-containing protein [Pseudomonadota bacterium]
MHILKLSLYITLILLYISSNFVVAGSNQRENPPVKGKEALNGEIEKNSFPIIEMQPDTSICLEACIRRNQMASVGFAVIQEQCRLECNFESTLALLESSNKEDYARGVKALTEMNDNRAVIPLIIALKKDLEERTGLWAWIIPALGSLGDPAATSVLIQTLTINDDYWLGREMSAKALGTIGDPSAIQPLLSAASRADTRDAAIKALVNFQDKRAVNIFLSALDPEEEEQTRKAAIKGLHLLGSIAVPEMIKAFAYFSSEHPETSKRLALCRLLGTSGDERAIKMLQKSVTDPDKIIKQCVEEFLQVQK